MFSIGRALRGRDRAPLAYDAVLPASGSTDGVPPTFSQNPASTGSVTPVMNRASSDANHSTALLVSMVSTHGTGRDPGW